MPVTASQAACSLCGGSSSMVLHRGARYAPDVDIRRCADCGLVYLTPLPSSEELEAYYANSYRSDYQDPPLEDRYTGDVDEARARVLRLMPLLRPDARVLEVGSGSGAFLKAAQPHVAEVAGVEPEEEARAWVVHHLDVPVASQIEDAGKSGHFDLVVLFHVLEHVPDPVGFLGRLGSVLSPSGRMVIEVPNVDDALVALYKLPAYLDFYYQKAHLYYFSKQTLASVFSRAGFASEIQGIQRYDLSNHLRWMLSGQPGGQAHYAGVLGPSVASAYAESLIAAGLSDTLWAVASKVKRGATD